MTCRIRSSLSTVALLTLGACVPPEGCQPDVQESPIAETQSTSIRLDVSEGGSVEFVRRGVEETELESCGPAQPCQRDLDYTLVFEDVLLTPRPVPGWRLVGWTGEACAAEDDGTVLIPLAPDLPEVSCEVEFEPVPGDDMEPAVQVSIDASPSSWVSPGETIVLTASSDQVGLHYTWYRIDEDAGAVLVEGASAVEVASDVEVEMLVELEVRETAMSDVLATEMIELTFSELPKPDPDPDPDAGPEVPVRFEFFDADSGEPLWVPGAITVGVTDASGEAQSCSNDEGSGCELTVQSGVVELQATSGDDEWAFYAWAGCESSEGTAAPEPADASDASVTLSPVPHTCRVYAERTTVCSSAPLAVPPMGETSLQIEERSGGVGPFSVVTPTLVDLDGVQVPSYVLGAGSTELRVSVTDPDAVGSHYMTCDWTPENASVFGCYTQIPLGNPIFPQVLTPTTYALEVRESVTSGGEACREGTITFLMEREF